MKTILQIVPAKSWGGGERYIYDLTEQLQKRGYNVIVAGRNSKIIADKFNELVKFISLPFLFMFDFYTSLKISRIIKQYDVKIIHVHIFKDAFMALFGAIFSRKDVKIIMTRHQVKASKNIFIYRWLYSKIDKIIFVSEAAKNEFLSTNPTISLSKITTIINSIDDRRLGHISPLDDLSDDAVIGFAGRISSEKGIDKLIEALSILKREGKNFSCKIAGTGDQEYVQFIKSMISESKLDDVVEMSGFITNMGSFISSINIAVLPSTWIEPCSLMAIEYMAAGRPLVASNRGGHAEIIENGVTGILIEARNSGDLANGIGAIIDNPDLRKKIGAAASEKYNKDLKFDIFIDRIVNQYESLIG